jgi:hypothetical protein
MARVLPAALLMVSSSLSVPAQQPDRAPAIIERVAATVDSATEARRQFVYQQKVRGTMSTADGKPSSRETREYTVIPRESASEKTLISYLAEYREGNRMVAANDPERKGKGGPGDRESVHEMIDNLVNAKNSRDGIPPDLFPLRAADLPFYRFRLKGESVIRGRRAYDIVFEPADMHNLCARVGWAVEDNPCHQWKGEVWVDAEDFQPARIETSLAKNIPWGVRVFMGIDAKQAGFSVNYQRVAENVWFPVTYGTEFQLRVFWAYRRTIALSMENNDFRRTSSDSTIHFDLPAEPEPVQVPR